MKLELGSARGFHALLPVNIVVLDSMYTYIIVQGTSNRSTISVTN